MKKLLKWVPLSAGLALVLATLPAGVSLSTAGPLAATEAVCRDCMKNDRYCCGNPPLCKDNYCTPGEEWCKEQPE